MLATVDKAGGQAVVANSPYTLLGTLTMTGASQTLSGIAGTYREIYMEIAGALNSQASAFNLSISGNGVNFGTVSAIGSMSSTIPIDGAFRFMNVQSLAQYGVTITGADGSSGGTLVSLNTIIPKHATGGTSKLSAIKFETSVGTFSAGTVPIWGIS